MSNAQIGYGTLFERDSGGAVFVAIAEVVSVTPPQLSKDTPDATHMSSPDGYREFIAGLRDAGEASLELNYLPTEATQVTLRTDFDSDVAGNYRMTFPDASSIAFTGFVTALSPAVPLDDKMALSVTIKVTGKPTFA
jgi:predicted secreted protein